MKIVKDGTMFVAIPVSIGLVLLVLGAGWAWFSAFILLGMFFGYFFRDPQCDLVIGDNLVIAPSYGRVMEVARHGEYHEIRIFLSVFDVHLQRSPCAGVLEKVEYVPGKCLPAMAKNAHLVNEQNIFHIETPRGKVIDKQIAGILARRVVSWVQAGQMLAQGQKIGFIKFGSQVDITVPLKASVLVQAGDNVVAGKTIIARFEQ
jgi:phosphatidylserine decarboxylase